MTAQEAIKNAYAITETMSANGAALDKLAALRASLREAYAIVEKLEQSNAVEEDDGK